MVVNNVFKWVTDKKRDPNYKQLSGQIPKDIVIRFKAECAKRETTISEQMELLIQQWFEELDSTPENKKGKDLA